MESGPQPQTVVDREKDVEAGTEAAMEAEAGEKIQAPAKLVRTASEADILDTMHPSEDVKRRQDEYREMVEKAKVKPDFPTAGEAAAADIDDDVEPEGGVTGVSFMTDAAVGDDDDVDEDAYIPYVPTVGSDEEEDEEEGDGGGTASQLALTSPGDPFKIRPSLSEKFRPGPVQYWIEKCAHDVIGDKPYSSADAVEWSKLIVREILDKTKAMKFGRYKLLAQVTIGERNGQGLASAQRCLWDADADCYATHTYIRDSLFCIGTVYAIYFY